MTLFTHDSQWLERVRIGAEEYKKGQYLQTQREVDLFVQYLYRAYGVGFPVDDKTDSK